MIDDYEKVKNEVLPLVRTKILSGEITLEKEIVNKKSFGYYSNFFLKTKEKTVKPNTIRLYNFAVSKFDEKFKDTDIKNIKPSDIKKHLFDMNTSTSSMKVVLSVVSSIFNEAVLDDEILSNPCSKIKLGKVVKKEILPFSKDEVSKILNQADTWFANFLAAGFYTGARTGELIALKWQNVDLKNKKIYIDSTRGQGGEGTTKTGKSRYVPIFDMLVPYLEKQQRLTGMKRYVFLTPGGKNLQASTIYRFFWEPLLRQLNIPYRKIYTTRHTFATTMLASGKFSLNQIASMMGHSDINTLIQHYNKFIDSESMKIDTNIDVFCNGFCNGVSISA